MAISHAARLRAPCSLAPFADGEPRLPAAP